MTTAITADEKTEFDRLRDEAVLLRTKAREIAEVTDAPSEARAAEFLKQIKIRRDVAETARGRLVKPLNDHVKMINAEFKITTGPLGEADALVRQGITAYRNSQTFIEAERRKEMVEIAARAAVAQGDVKALTAIQSEYESASAAAPRKVETQSGEARFRKVWKWELDNPLDLPDEYWMPDEKKIAAAIKMKTAHECDPGPEHDVIPGVRVWSEMISVIV